MDKASLRRQSKKRLDTLTNEEVHQKSSSICNNLLANIDWKCIKTVSCYRSLPLLREVETSTIISYIRESWPHIELDVVQPDKQSIITSKQYDLVIVPVLAFDSSNNRLGRGGGWYDRFLSNQEHARAIGLAFDSQAVDSIPIEEFDVELEDIITESSIS